MDLIRLCELAGIDGARDLAANKDPLSDRASQPKQRYSWEDGQDEFNSDVQDINSPHKLQEVEAYEQCLNALDGMDQFLSLKDKTEPQYQKIKEQVSSLKSSIEGLMNSISNPPLQSPKDSGGGTTIDPSMNGHGPVG